MLRYLEARFGFVFLSSKIVAYFATLLTVLRRVKDGQLEEAKRAVVVYSRETVQLQEVSTDMVDITESRGIIC